ncbi:MAG: pyridoxal phosphate-dependent aminotransferase family protein [Bacteroidales bacterium]|jgi:glycine C-acetyltransferase|nr:pyridoxal phosphate-dependent aminotransferase family protein [Bacteroidales bacterium]MBQ2104397.1 pyridoxal phosphate-dependent aminotransferase family protein [Bacteroidales bacterium]MBQ3984956.1 pyridoxal phosphate-dependent aminotransferase family protein [Bacteroidales bacterium]MBQ4189534.1 pyridoxal phosphate-dependent aminotransferase family protein [Bacteroidales bacterium]MBQ5415593.1 pyridoxal phosphate-dependent aminotransferase family protein [Bacteroidales bacterium]
MYKDIFEKIMASTGGPIGQYREKAEGYFAFPKLEGELGPHMRFNGQEVLCWSLNNYLGLANHPEIRKADAEGAARWGMAYPMGSRMLTGHTSLHEKFERMLAEFECKEAAFLYNFGYQGIVSTIDALVGRHDVIVYDAECHACLLDGIRLHIGEKYKFRHNNIADCEKVLARACKVADENGGGVLVITEGVFGMTGALGILDQIVALKEKYKFRFMIDDAHGFGVMGPHGRGTSEHFGVMDGVDLYIGAYAKSMATIGGFVASKKEIITYLRYNMRSQMYAKALPMPIVEGCIKRLEIINSPEGDQRRAQLWKVTRRLQEGFRELGYEIGPAEACVTPVHLACGINQASNIAVDLRENYHIFCSIVTYPVIPPGMLIFRIIPTAAHSMEDVERTLDAFRDIKERLARGEYDKEIPDMAIIK